MSSRLHFLGGAGTVTGSKFLIENQEHRVLVDCGLFQGLKSLRLKNWDELPVDASSIDAVILTHAHIDHSGYIPRLIKSGFRGKIYATPATYELCKILLPDCAYVMNEEADYLNLTRKSKHHPALPLFNVEEAKASLEFFEPVAFDKTIALHDGFEFEFKYVGHILGAASVLIKVDGKRILFTGDIGRANDDILYPPKLLPPMDYLITESTYGDRTHPNTDVLNQLESIINATYKKSGVVMIPAFAVGRAMSIMHALYQLLQQNRIPAMPIYLNSPMAISFSEIFFRYRDQHKLDEATCRGISQMIKLIHTTEESKALNHKKGPMLIISASGMITGGRILHHIKSFGSDERNAILLTGFQAAGTRGDALQKGAKELKIFGDYVPIRASVHVLENFSAHADYNEIIQWFKQSSINPKQVFLAHGEPVATDQFRRRLEESFGWKCTIPSYGDLFDLTD